MLTIKDVQLQYGLARYTLMNAVNDGRLTAYRPNGKSYLFKPSDIERFIESTKVRIFP